MTAACVTWGGPLHAQPLDAAAYRAAKRTATATFLDRRKPIKERLAAAKGLRYPDAATFTALLRVGADKSEDDAIRAEALRHHRYDEQYLDTVLKILDDPNDGGPLLDSALAEDLGRRTTFRLPAPIRQRIQRTLRALLDDKRDPVRLSAYRVLAADHDAVAIERLAESLRRGQGAPVPLPEAIEMLDNDGSAKHIAALRPYLANPDPRVQARAARALALDADSRPKIVAMARDPKAPQEIRLHALRALSREDSQFAEYAIPLVANTREDPRVRAEAMKAFAGRMNYTKVSAADQIRFAQTVDKVAVERGLESVEAREMQDAARKLRGFLRKAFPEVKKHYETL